MWKVLCDRPVTKRLPFRVAGENMMGKHAQIVLHSKSVSQENVCERFFRGEEARGKVSSSNHYPAVSA